MTRLVVRSALFAFVAACSGSKHADESIPPTPAAPTNGSASQTTEDAASVPAPPIEGSHPGDMPQGMTGHAADDQRVAQAPPDAGVRAPVRDAGAPGRDAAGADAGPAPGAPPADAGVPAPNPVPPGSAPAPGTPPTSPR